MSNEASDSAQAPTTATPPPGVPLIPTPAAVPAPKYPLDERTLGALNERFEYHPPQGDQRARYELIRAKVRELALIIVGNTPVSREQALAMTHLDEAMMFANAAIARNE